MKIKIGICGLPNSGKSTFIKLISKTEVLIAPYPFSTLKPQEYVVPIITPELKNLHLITQTSQIIFPYLFFIDIPGLIRGAHKGEGLGNEFLSYLRGCDVILEIVRNFKREDVPHPEGNINPLRDIKIIEEEVILADQEILNRNKKQKVQKEILLSNKDWFLLINGPFSIDNKLKLEIEQFNSENNSNNHIKFKKIYFLDLLWELELSENDELQKEFELQIFNFLNQFRKDLNLIQFFTFNKEITQGWFVKKGTSLIEAASFIHSDFMLKFKIAEVINLNDFLKIKNWEEAKKLGLIKYKGRDSFVEENDIILIKI